METGRAFRYNGGVSADLLAEWPLSHSVHDFGLDKTERTFTWTDPRMGLRLYRGVVETHDSCSSVGTVIGSKRITLGDAG